MSRFNRWVRQPGQAPAQVQPRFGHVDHHDGTRTPVQFQTTPDPLVFLAVTMSGDPAICGPRDAFYVDALGPDQEVQFTVAINRKDQ